MMTSQSRRRSVHLALAAFTACLVVLAVAGCYPGGPEDSSDTLVSLTFNSETADYSGILTYAMPDTVLPLYDPEDDSSSSLDRRYDRMILSSISSQLDARGLQRIDEPDENNKPDVVVLTGSVETEGYLVYSTWGYPGWGWGYPSWGYGYYGYPGYGYYGYPYSNIAHYKQGSIVWVMLDIRHLDPAAPDSSEVLPIWVAGINGAATQNSPDPTPLIQQGIAQCFEQSPYIQADSSGN